jgi:ribosomal protein S18 acetylase RimI-like enzyme
MTTDTRFRQLLPGEVGLFRDLIRVFAEAFDDPATYLDAPPTDDYLRGLLSGPTVIVVVALDGETVVGGLVAYVLEKFERARSEIYIYDLAVAAPYRRRGIATGTIRELQRIAASRGAWVIFVQADPIDPPAIALYESLGTREDVHHFDIPVTARPS